MPSPSIDISALEQALTNTPRGSKEMVTNGVVPALSAAILKTQFGEDLAFPRKSGRFVIGGLDNGNANAQYDAATGNIHMDPMLRRANQPMYQRAVSGGGYVGDSPYNPTTSDVLHYLNTMRHELIHARMPRGSELGREYNQLVKAEAAKQGKSWRDLSERDNVLLSESDLPSMQYGNNLEEFLATAIPVLSADSKVGVATAPHEQTRQQELLTETKRILNRSPVLQELLNRWTRPELRNLQQTK